MKPSSGSFLSKSVLGYERTLIKVIKSVRMGYVGHVKPRGYKICIR
jgi:hypothetical protein